MRAKYKENGKVKKLSDDFYKRYMDSMLKVIQTTENAVAEEKKQGTGKLNSDLQDMNTQADDIKAHNLILIKDLLEIISK